MQKNGGRMPSSRRGGLVRIKAAVLGKKEEGVSTEERSLISRSIERTIRGCGTRNQRRTSRT